MAIDIAADSLMPKKKKIGLIISFNDGEELRFGSPDVAEFYWIVEDDHLSVFNTDDPNTSILYAPMDGVKYILET